VSAHREHDGRGRLESDQGFQKDATMLSSFLFMLSAMHGTPAPMPVASFTPEASITASLGFSHARTIVAGTLTGTMYFNDVEAGRRPLFGEMRTNNPSNRRWENGRVWISTPRIGPEPTPREWNWQEPGPRAYGAPDNDSTLIYVLNGAYLVSISPWDRLEDPRLAHLEAQRNRWLYERGYVGGVRTFVNDAYADRSMAYAANAGGDARQNQLPGAGEETWTREGGTAGEHDGAHEIQPRGVIALPPDMPRFRKRMDVRRSLLQGVPVIIQSHDERRSVVTVTGRGNSWSPTMVVAPARRVVDAQPGASTQPAATEQVAAAEGV
jgi:hypothetical protein